MKLLNLPVVKLRLKHKKILGGYFVKFYLASCCIKRKNLKLRSDGHDSWCAFEHECSSTVINYHRLSSTIMQFGHVQIRLNIWLIVDDSFCSLNERMIVFRSVVLPKTGSEVKWLKLPSKFRRMSCYSFSSIPCRLPYLPFAIPPLINSPSHPLLRPSSFVAIKQLFRKLILHQILWNYMCH